MKTSAAVRHDIEAALYRRVPGALSPQIRTERVRLPTGIRGVDAVARGGFPLGAITEIVGPESSGRTTLAASFAAQRAAEGQVFAWVDVNDSLHPESMAAAGVNLEQMLWVRCGKTREASPSSKATTVSGGAAMLDRNLSAPSLGGGCGSPHPRSEGKGLPQAIGGLMGGLAAELMLGVESRPSTKSQPGGNKALMPAKRKDKSIGTPGAANRSVQGESAFSWRSNDREEQVATDRRPARRAGVVMSSRTGVWEPRCSESPERRQGSAPEGPSSDTRHGTDNHADDVAKQVLRFTQPSGHLAARSPSESKPTGRQHRQELLASGVAGGTGTKAQPWSSIDQGLRAIDMLLNAGGFGVVVFDLSGVAAEAVWRIPMATWFRFRAAAERTQVCFVLLTQHSCARSAAELVLDMAPGTMRSEGRVMTGASYQASVGRQRFVRVNPHKVVAIQKHPGDYEACDPQVEGRRLPPQSERAGDWYGQTTWSKAGNVGGVRVSPGEARVRRRTGRSE